MSYLIYAAIPLFLITIFLEHKLLKSHHDKKGYETKDALASISMGLGNVMISAMIKGGVLVLYLYLYKHFALFADFLSPQNPISWLLLFFGDEFCYYWFHRFGHRMRMGWAAHGNHHSSQYYNLSTALRQSWTTPLFHWFFYLPLPLIGFHPVAILTMQAFSLLYQYWIHTEIIGHMGWFEKFFNTPSHHRVHHGSNQQYLDKNYGGFLIIYDKLFGSFEPEKEPVSYGLTTNIHTYNPLKIAAHEWMNLWRDMRHDITSGVGWRQALKRPIMPPGWRETGVTPYYSEQERIQP